MVKTHWNWRHIRIHYSLIKVGVASNEIYVVDAIIYERRQSNQIYSF